MIVLALFIGFALFWLVHRIKTGGFQSIANNVLHRAEMECESKNKACELALQEKTFSHKQKLEKQIQELQQKQAKCEKELKTLQQERQELEKNKQLHEQAVAKLKKESAKISTTRKQLRAQLEKVAKISPDEAKEQLMQKVQGEIGTFLRHAKEEMEEEAEKVATKILTTTINRIALPFVSEATVTTVTLPSDDMKGRIIGREGRNIRLLEQLTGVNYLLDETPNAVVISSFDPKRKLIAKNALQALIRDGRIHAARIEEIVTKCQNDFDKLIRQAGEKAAFKAGVLDLHPELLKLLGELSLRYSHGQNLLDHSVEVSLLMSIMASELKLNMDLAKRMGLLHDIGKASSHEYPGSHSIIGHNLAIKHHESQEVANGIGSHHNEMSPLTIEATLLNVADTLSAARPGARSEAIEHYVKRLEKMESICSEHESVEKAYALQAGREVRVIVQPDRVSDDAAAALARTLVKKLEQELSFTGKIKVTVIREKKITDYAS